METFLFVLCTTIPSHIIVFSLYWNFPWRSRPLALGLICCNILLKMLTVSWISLQGGNIRIVEWIFSTIGFLIYFLTLRVSWGKALYTFVFVVDYLSIVRGLATFTSVRFFSADSQSWTSCLLCLLFYLLTLPWMLRFFRRTSQAVLNTEAPFLWNTIWLIPAMVTTVILLFTNTYNPTSSIGWKFLLARVVLLICVLAVYGLLLRGIASVQRQSMLELQARQSEQILSFQRTQYAHLQDYMEEIRRARHDLRQHQRMILSFLESGNQEELRSYLQTQMAAQPAESFQSYCRNYAVNGLLNYYGKLISASGIDLEIEADLPEHLSVPEPDLCVALGNMIENAMEACAGQDSPLIRIAARRTDAQAITLIVDNTAPDAPRRQADGSFLSSKHPGAGIGTQSIQYIAQRYGGAADFIWRDHMFYASLFLNPNNRPADPPKPL